MIDNCERDIKHVFVQKRIKTIREIDYGTQKSESRKFGGGYMRVQLVRLAPL